MTQKEKIYLTPKQAKEVLPDEKMIHFYQAVNTWAICGGSYSKKEIYKKIDKAKSLEIAGDHMRGQGHGLSITPKGAKSLCDLLFIETDETKLSKYDS